MLRVKIGAQKIGTTQWYYTFATCKDMLDVWEYVKEWRKEQGHSDRVSIRFLNEEVTLHDDEIQKS